MEQHLKSMNIFIAEKTSFGVVFTARKTMQLQHTQSDYISR